MSDSHTHLSLSPPPLSSLSPPLHITCQPLLHPHVSLASSYVISLVIPSGVLIVFYFFFLSFFFQLLMSMFCPVRISLFRNLSSSPLSFPSLHYLSNVLYILFFNFVSSCYLRNSIHESSPYLFVSPVPLPDHPSNAFLLPNLSLLSHLFSADKEQSSGGSLFMRVLVAVLVSHSSRHLVPRTTPRHMFTDHKKHYLGA